MATPNIVPKLDGEGALGREGRAWASVQANLVTSPVLRLTSPSAEQKTSADADPRSIYIDANGDLVYGGLAGDKNTAAKQDDFAELKSLVDAFFTTGPTTYASQAELEAAGYSITDADVTDNGDGTYTIAFAGISGKIQAFDASYDSLQEIINSLSADEGHITQAEFETAIRPNIVNLADADSPHTPSAISGMEPSRLYRINATTGVIFNLPASSGLDGFSLIFKSVGTGVITLQPSGSDTIDGQANPHYLYTQKESVTLIANGNNGWDVV